jgi:flagellar FliJ protein
MKKFKFSLATVKEYKEKLLDNLKLEHGIIMTAVREQEEVIRGMEETEKLVNKELNERNRKGITPFELMNYQRYIKVLQNDIKLEYEKLDKLKQAEEEKLEEVVEMKKETSSFEKLEEKRLKEYNGIVRKEQELFIEEFVTNKKYARRE